MQSGRIVVGLIVAGAVGGAAQAAVLRVDVTGSGCRRAQFTRIQNALDAAAPDDKIVVCPGIYPEQITVAKRVKLRGLPGAVVRPAGMAANTSSLRTGSPIAAIAVVSAPATIRSLEFDGSAHGYTDCGGADPLLVGVYFRGTAGQLSDSVVHGLRLGSPDVPCETGAGILVQGDGGTPERVTLSGNVVYDYHRAGITVNENGARARLLRNTVAGAGATSTLSQNGIQVGFGAVGLLKHNIVQNNVGAASGCVLDAGNLSYEASNGTIEDNVFTGNAIGVWVKGDRNRIQRNTVDGFAGGQPAGLEGIVVDGTGNQVKQNRVSNHGEVGIRIGGVANKVVGNAITHTSAENGCQVGENEVDVCQDAITACGVGLALQGGSHVVKGNTFSDNDVDLQDDSLHHR